MEERETFEETAIFRFAVLKGKLIVYQATSLKNQIRFYVNKTQFFSATECAGGCLVQFGDENDDNSKISIIEELKRFMIFFFMGIGMFASCIALIMYLSEILQNLPLIIFTEIVIFFIGTLLNIVICEAMATPFCLKSKHAAEHMMVNFLESNKRLPKNMEELKKCSRFAPGCSSRELIEGIPVEFTRSMIGIIAATIIGGIVELLFHTSIVATTIIVTYLLVRFVAGKAITKAHKFKCIIIPMRRVLTHIAQYANTTRKVKDEDLILAYYVARKWLQAVYPEYYDEKNDTFLNNI
jgi:predicted signal transduction protein with EAL and GGDEF domain